MMKKILGIISILLCLAAVMIGLIKRQSYTDFTAKGDVMDHFSVALWDKGIAPDFMKLMRDELPKTNIILRVKAEGKVDYLFKLNRQHAKVLEVYRGNGISVGDEITVTTSSWRFYFDDMTANMGFVNFMKKNNEYLLFLEEKIDVLDPDDKNVYRVPDFIIVPVFNYEEKKNVIADTRGESSYVPYSDVSQNEFFVSSYDSLDEILDFKHELLEKYPR